MLPSRPSPRNGGGLPTAPRSRSIGRSRQEDSSSSYSRESTGASSRTVRSQRSMNNISSSGRDRSEPPPMPSSRSRYNNNSSRDYDSPPVSRKESDASSSSTVSTTASYFMDKIRAGYESSRTSLDDDYEPPKRERERGRGQESRSARQEARSSYEGKLFDFDSHSQSHKALLRRLHRRRPCCPRRRLFTLGQTSLRCRDSWC